MTTSKRTGLGLTQFFCSFIIAGVASASAAYAVTAERAATPEGQAESLSPRKYSPGAQEILKMVQAKVDPEIIKTYIKNAATAYPLTADEIIDLQKQGVPSEVLTAMLQHGGELRARAPLPATPRAPGPSTQYAPAPTPYDAPSAPGYPEDYSSYAVPYDYGSPYYVNYPTYYGYGYPYSYSYWWWNNYGGYPWYGFSYPYYGYWYGHHYYHGGHGYEGHHDGYPWNGGYAHNGGYPHNGGYYGHNRGAGSGSGPGYGAPYRNQPWRPVGSYAARSAGFSGNRAFAPAGGFSRPAMGGASRPGAFAMRTGGFHGASVARSGGGFGGGRSAGGGHR